MEIDEPMKKHNAVNERIKRKYFTYQLISCLLWAIICTCAGYFFGATLKNVLGDVKKYDQYIAIGVLGAGVVVWLVKDIRRKRS
jgi:membrane protein DedA with SNARE-associated domain